MPFGEQQAQRNGIHLLSHSPSPLWGGRALFNPKTLSLHLTRLTPQDAGRFTCRVLGYRGEDAVNETFYVRGKFDVAEMDIECTECSIMKAITNKMTAGPMREPGLRVESSTVSGQVNSTSKKIGPFLEGQRVDLFCAADSGV